MVKVITYGTYDLLHYGHIRLLERAKALGDYLIVGVTSDTFDRERGKSMYNNPSWNEWKPCVPLALLMNHHRGIRGTED